jgi:hypothetical protein
MNFYRGCSARLPVRLFWLRRWRESGSLPARMTTSASWSLATGAYKSSNTGSVASRGSRDERPRLVSGKEELGHFATSTHLNI